MKKPILITGHGSGFLSSAIFKQLADFGHEVVLATPEESEWGITFNSPSTMEEKVIEIINERVKEPVLFTPPLTRKERRAQERRDRKNAK